MILTVKNTNLSLSIYPDNVQETITFQVIPEGRKKLTIADKYIFGSSYPDKDKTEISGRFCIKKIQPAYSEHHKLNSERIGYLSFFEAIVDEFGEYSFPAQVIFTVFIQEEQYKDIKQAVLAKSPVKHLTFSSNELDMGWEPDASHHIWKANPEGSKLNLEKAYISDFSIGFGDDFDDEYWEGREESKSEIKQTVDAKPSSLKLFFDEYKFFIIVTIIGLFFLINK
jgi:hypothetical protein